MLVSTLYVNKLLIVDYHLKGCIIIMMAGLFLKEVINTMQTRKYHYQKLAGFELIIITFEKDCLFTLTVQEKQTK
jgi:hypothetical protein